MVVTALAAIVVCGSVPLFGRGDSRPSGASAAGTARQDSAQAAQPASPAPAAGPAEDVVRALYARVTFDAGKNVDWEQVKALFIPEAVIVLRASRTSMKVLDLDGFVADFVSFIKQAKLEERAFEEKVVSVKTQEYGEVARSLVHYAARIPSNTRPAQDGIDVFLLMKKDGAWRIVSIVNEIVRPGVPIPEELRK
jgi:hypothetical protein